MPSINQIDPLLPVIVLSASDFLELQRRIRSWKIFYCLVGPLDGEETRGVLRAALRRTEPDRRTAPRSSPGP